MNAMREAVPLSLPRWEWCTVGTDLSWLLQSVRDAVFEQERLTAEIHLLCGHSSHAAVIQGSVLEVRWRKETRPEGMELWDTILEAAAPFSFVQLEQLWRIWELPPAVFEPEYPTVASFLAGVIASEPAIVPVAVTRTTRPGSLQGIKCALETLDLDIGRPLQSFSLEHEDPSVIAQLLAELGVEADVNINLPHALRIAAGLQAPGAGKQSWARKSNASTW